MGGPDQRAKDIFAEEVPRLFGSAVVWSAGVELSFVEMRLDGILSVLEALVEPASPAPWSLLRPGLVVVELKMPGDHLDWGALQRALLRRQATQTGQAEGEPADERWVALWLVAPHLPGWLGDRYQIAQLAPGCWGLAGSPYPVVWVAANELPLDEPLVPFLVARSGKKLVEFLAWSVGRKPVEWFDRVLRWVAMTPEQIEEMREKMRALSPPDWGDDDEARHQDLMHEIMHHKARLQYAQQLAEQRQVGALQEARKALTRLMVRRGLGTTPEQQAQIEGCSDLPRLERWHDQAITAASADEALR